MKDFPKTIYVDEEGFLTKEIKFCEGEQIAVYTLKAIYTLKEVKKKVTNVELKDL